MASRHTSKSNRPRATSFLYTSWTDKDDTTDWTAYFHLRNRLITMALHSPYDVRPAIVHEGFRTTFKHLMAMEYSTVALHHKAIRERA